MSRFFPIFPINSFRMMGQEFTNHVYSFGIDHNLSARTVASVCAGDSENIVFLVGTQSLHSPNKVFCCEFDPQTENISASSFAHPDGEIWHISTSPSDISIFATTYHNVKDSSKFEGAIWKFPGDISESDVLSNPELSPLDEIMKFTETDVKCISWCPREESNECAVIGSDGFSISDVDAQNTSQKYSVSDNKRAVQISGGSYIRSKAVALFQDATIKIIDVTSGKVSFDLKNAHVPLVRGCDVHPYTDTLLVSSGDDGLIKFWDLRNAQNPLSKLQFEPHSHWVYGVRWNPLHDGLILSWSTDSTVALSHVPSLVTTVETSGLSDDSDTDIEDTFPKQQEAPGKALPEGPIKLFDDHEDSVYAADWSKSHPLMFASISYDNRLLIYHVPKEICSALNLEVNL